MVNKIKNIIIIISVMQLAFITGCRKENNNSTDMQLPELLTSSVYDITTNSAKCGGIINSQGGSEITKCGVCWSTTNTNPTVNDNKTNDSLNSGSFTSILTGLTSLTTYYIRAYAINNGGTTYGDTRIFTTSFEYGDTMTDMDGNIYPTVIIGTQTWMAENLKVTHYKNGDQILELTDPSDWSYTSYGAYCNYNNDTALGNEYGRLYNYFAVNSYKGLCPEGWHVPSKEEWETMVNYLGGEAVAGGKMKETGTSHWLEPNTGATNESGFNALPSGSRYNYQSNFLYLNKYAIWWTSSDYSIYNQHYYVYTTHFNSELEYSYTNGEIGFCVRCLKDD